MIRQKKQDQDIAQLIADTPFYDAVAPHIKLDNNRNPVEYASVYAKYELACACLAEQRQALDGAQFEAVTFTDKILEQAVINTPEAEVNSGEYKALTKLSGVFQEYADNISLASPAKAHLRVGG